ncbi:monovalent cation/H+ antiporter complex subunit F [Kocuria palustris]|uniref:monovalent cation/H+ antiporter complex subunit F n=1 Tax=Kocuria palustris TaxID=71999 RepID=UPI0036639AA3
MSTIVMAVCLVMLAGAAAGVLYRLVKGPSLLDRVLSSDVLLSVVVAAIALEMVWSDHSDYMMVFVTVSLLGFIGSVSVARFVQPTRPRKTGQTDEGATKEPVEGERAEQDHRPAPMQKPSPSEKEGHR